eukprot:932673-Ditylum_brightwellii.AAC.1
MQDLAFLAKADVDTILGSDTSTFIVGRKLSKVTEFITRGGNLLNTTTMQGVIECDNLPPTATTPSLSSHPSRSTIPIKLSPADFPNFSGDIEDQEN